MSSCKPFKLDFKCTEDALYKKFITLAHEHHGKITGGPKEGSITVSVPIFKEVDATYSINGQSVSIHVTHKSPFLACSIIKSYIKSQIPPKPKKLQH